MAPDELTAATQDAESSNPFLYTVGAWVSLVLTVLYLLAMCVFRKKVNTAACLVKESTIVIKDRWSMLLFPFVIIALQIPIFVYFLAGFSLIGTANRFFAEGA